MVVLSKKRSLDITIGDGLAHFTIRRSRNKKGQRFLGFYIKDQEIFSPQTHGMIGECEGVGASSPLHYHLKGFIIISLKGGEAVQEVSNLVFYTYCN